jgi:hypothetical protein
LSARSAAPLREDSRAGRNAWDPGGGFIMGSSHSVMVSAKPGNFRAMVAETHEAGRYPIDI